MSAKILSESDLLKVVHGIWGCDVDLVDCQVTPFSEQKLGFLADHWSVLLTVRDVETEEIKTRKLFMKTKPENGLSELSDDMNVFPKEVRYFNDLLPLLKVGFVGEDWCPACYLASDNYLVFEDLCERGFSLRGNFLNKEEITAVMTTLANMHAASLIAEKKLGRPLNEVYPFVFDDKYFFDNGKFCNWIAVGFDLSAALARKLGLDADKMRSILDHLWEGLKPSKTHQNVASHADLWSNNMLFSNGSPVKNILVDFQLTRYSPLVDDVLFAMYLCTTRDFRRKNEKALMKHYYAVLCETLRKNKQDVRVPAWSQLTQGTEQQRLTIAILAMLYYPTSTLNGEQLADLFKNDQEMLDFIFKTRVPKVFERMEKDKVFAANMTNAVQEVYELGLQFEPVQS